MFTPYREVTIVHAVRQPLDAPWANILAPCRSAGPRTRTSTATCGPTPKAPSGPTCCRFTWTPTTTDQPGRHRLPGEQGPGGRVPLGAGQSDVIPVKDVRHDFGDTKHHEVFYSLLATTRFLEYFTETTDVKLTGTSAVVVSVKHFAPGTVVVTGHGASGAGHV